MAEYDFAKLRPIRGDGHCYYRAVMTGLLEQIVAQPDKAKKNALLYALASRIDASSKIIDPIAVQEKDKACYKLLIEKLRDAAQGKCWSTCEELESDLKGDFDWALVRVARYMTAQGVSKLAAADKTTGELGISPAKAEIINDLLDCKRIKNQNLKRALDFQPYTLHLLELNPEPPLDLPNENTPSEQIRAEDRPDRINQILNKYINNTAFIGLNQDNPTLLKIDNRYFLYGSTWDPSSQKHEWKYTELYTGKDSLPKLLQSLDFDKQKTLEIAANSKAVTGELSAEIERKSAHVISPAPEEIDQKIAEYYKNHVITEDQSEWASDYLVGTHALGEALGIQIDIYRDKRQGSGPVVCNQKSIPKAPSIPLREGAPVVDLYHTGGHYDVLYNEKVIQNIDPKFIKLSAARKNPFNHQDIKSAEANIKALKGQIEKLNNAINNSENLKKIYSSREEFHQANLQVKKDRSMSTKLWDGVLGSAKKNAPGYRKDLNESRNKKEQYDAIVKAEKEQFLEREHLEKQYRIAAEALRQLQEQGVDPDQKAHHQVVLNEALTGINPKQTNQSSTSKFKEYPSESKITTRLVRGVTDLVAESKRVMDKIKQGSQPPA